MRGNLDSIESAPGQRVVADMEFGDGEPNFVNVTELGLTYCHYRDDRRALVDSSAIEVWANRFQEKFSRT